MKMDSPVAVEYCCWANSTLLSTDRVCLCLTLEQILSGRKFLQFCYCLFEEIYNLENEQSVSKNGDCSFLKILAVCFHSLFYVIEE